MGQPVGADVSEAEKGGEKHDGGGVGRAEHDEAGAAKEGADDGRDGGAVDAVFDGEPGDGGVGHALGESEEGDVQTGAEIGERRGTGVVRKGAPDGEGIEVIAADEVADPGGELAPAFQEE